MTGWWPHECPSYIYFIAFAFAFAFDQSNYKKIELSQSFINSMNTTSRQQNDITTISSIQQLTTVKLCKYTQHNIAYEDHYNNKYT